MLFLSGFVAGATVLFLAAFAWAYREVAKEMRGRPRTRRLRRAESAEFKVTHEPGDYRTPGRVRVDVHVGDTPVHFHSASMTEDEATRLSQLLDHSSRSP